MMWSNIQSINIEMNKPRKPRHPEAPEAGEELMYVDLSREKLEDLYKQTEEWYIKGLRTLFLWAQLLLMWLGSGLLLLWIASNQSIGSTVYQFMNGWFLI